MKQMGRWVPIPDITQFWAPLLMASLLAAYFIWKMWSRRESYGVGLLIFHALSLLWFQGRMFSVLLTIDRRTTVAVAERIVLAAVAAGLVALSVWGTLDRERSKERERADLRGPDEESWSPEPIVGYRVTIHSLGGEYFTGAPASCRAGDTYHDQTKAPIWGCRCGYYAMKTLDHAIPYPFGLSGFPDGFAVIALLWGKSN